MVLSLLSPFASSMLYGVDQKQILTTSVTCCNILDFIQSIVLAVGSNPAASIKVGAPFCGSFISFQTYAHKSFID